MKQSKIKSLISISLSVLIAFAFYGCTGKLTENESLVFDSKNQTTQVTTQTQNTENEGSTSDTVKIDTYIILNNEDTTIKGDGAAFNNSTLTITKSGTYSLKGTLSDGSVYVNCNSGKVKLYLDSVTIHSTKTAPIFIENSPGEAQIILADGSENKLSDNADRTVDESTDYATATIYSKDDLQIKGNGSLEINAEFNKGVFSKNDIKICGGNLSITSADDAIRGKDSLTVLSGNLNINSGADGLRTNGEAEKGDITISGGNITISSTLDGIQATGSVLVSGGNISVTTAGGSTEITASTPQGGFGFKDHGTRPQAMHPESSNSETIDNTPSTKGIKADKDIEISGGSFAINSFDDAIHADDDLEISGGTFEIKTNDDGIHCENELEIKGGSIVINQSYEGIEGTEIEISGGSISVNATDDGLNAASASNQTENPAHGNTAQPALPEQSQGSQQPKPPQRSDKTGFGGGIPGDYDSKCKIEISGGTVRVNSQGDGIDSNGDIYMTGGTVIVFGPESNGNGALDYSGSFDMRGGRVLAVGSSAMAQGISSGFGSISTNGNFSANTVYTIVNSDEKEIISFVSPKAFANIVYSDNSLISGSTCKILSGGSHSGEAANGVYQNGSISSAREFATVTVK